MRAQSCLTLCNPMDCSLPGSSVHGIILASILERDAPGDIPDPGIESVPLASPALVGELFTTEPPGKSHEYIYTHTNTHMCRHIYKVYTLYEKMFNFIYKRNTNWNYTEMLFLIYQIGKNETVWKVTVWLGYRKLGTLLRSPEEWPLPGLRQRQDTRRTPECQKVRTCQRTVQMRQKYRAVSFRRLLPAKSKTIWASK